MFFTIFILLNIYKKRVGSHYYYSCYHYYCLFTDVISTEIWNINYFFQLVSSVSSNGKAI